MFNLAHYESVQRGEIFELEKAIHQCFRNEKSDEAFNMSSLVGEAYGEETLKLKTLRNKMSIFQLKDLITELLDMVRTQHRFIKTLLVGHKSQIRLWEDAVAEISKRLIQQRQNTLKNLQGQILQLKLSSERWMTELQGARAEITLLEMNKREHQELQIRNQEETEKLKQAFEEERQSVQKQMEMLRKDTYKTYEQNFQLQQRIRSLEDELEEQKENSQNTISQQSKQIQRFMKSIQSLSFIIRSKEQHITELRENGKFSSQHKRNRSNAEEPTKPRKGLDPMHHLNLESINRDKKSTRDNSFEKSEVDLFAKISPQTMEYIKPQTAKKTANQPTYLTPYYSKEREGYTQKSSRSKHKLPSQPSPQTQRVDKRPSSRAQLDFNLIQLEIDKLTDRLQSDLRRCGR